MPTPSLARSRAGETLSMADVARLACVLLTMASPMIEDSQPHAVPALGAAQFERNTSAQVSRTRPLQGGGGAYPATHGLCSGPVLVALGSACATSEWALADTGPRVGRALRPFHIDCAGRCGLRSVLPTRQSELERDPPIRWLQWAS